MKNALCYKIQWIWMYVLLYVFIRSKVISWLSFSFQCLNTSSILSIVAAEQASFITENIFDEISLLLLEIAIGYNEPCHVKLVFTEDRVSTYRDNILRRITAGNITAGIKLMPAQETLELIPLGKHFCITYCRNIYFAVN